MYSLFTGWRIAGYSLRRSDLAEDLLDKKRIVASPAISDAGMSSDSSSDREKSRQVYDVCL